MNKNFLIKSETMKIARDFFDQNKFIEVCQQATEAVDPSGNNPPPPKKGGYKNPGNWPPETFNGKLVQAHYYAMIELLDKHFGRLINYLKKINQLENNNLHLDYDTKVII